MVPGTRNAVTGCGLPRHDDAPRPACGVAGGATGFPPTAEADASDASPLMLPPPSRVAMDGAAPAAAAAAAEDADADAESDATSTPVACRPFNGVLRLAEPGMEGTNEAPSEPPAVAEGCSRGGRAWAAEEVPRAATTSDGRWAVDWEAAAVVAPGAAPPMAVVVAVAEAAAVAGLEWGKVPWGAVVAKVDEKVPVGWARASSLSRRCRSSATARLMGRGGSKVNRRCERWRTRIAVRRGDVECTAQAHTGTHTYLPPMKSGWLVLMCASSISIRFVTILNAATKGTPTTGDTLASTFGCWIYNANQTKPNQTKRKTEEQKQNKKARVGTDARMSRCQRLGQQLVNDIENSIPQHREPCELVALTAGRDAHELIVHQIHTAHGGLLQPSNLVLH